MRRLGRWVAPVAATAVSIAIVGCGASAPTFSSASPSPTPTPTPTPAASGPGPTSSRPTPDGKIVFYREAGVWPPPEFMIDPDGSNEIALQDDGLLPARRSPDGRTLLVRRLVNEWVRPAILDAKDASLVLLDAYPDRQMHLDPVGWSGDGARIFVFSGVDAVDPLDIGLYSVRASDGGDLTPVVLSPAGARDWVSPSPDASLLLVNRELGDGTSTLLVRAADGPTEHRLSTDDMVPVDLEFWGPFDGQGRISEAWSPDGRQIAFTVRVITADSTGLFIVNPDGTGLRQIVPTSIGAVSAQWSPDGSSIAFTSRLRSQPQVWIVGLDGSEPMPLTSDADGSTSVAPIWSPDGRMLLFERKQAGHVTLWTMNADGTAQTQVTKTPLADDYFGGYAWLAAPGG